MKRRTFITLLGGAAAAWPLAARAQQPARPRRIGLLSASPVSTLSGIYTGFIKGMRELGYVEAKDFVIEWRSAEGQFGRLADVAAELVRLNVDVIVTGVTAGIRPLQQATTTIPIVMAYSTDPVGNGFVASLARPGGNTTGLAGSSDDSSPKQLELLVTLVPNVSRIGLLGNPNSPTYSSVLKNTQAAAQKAGLFVIPIEARNPNETEIAFAELSKEQVDAVMVASDAVFFGQRQRIAALALRSRIPTMFSLREYAEAGGLMSYGEDLADFFRRAASFVDKIFKGAKPGDLPIEQPTTLHRLLHRDRVRWRCSQRSSRASHAGDGTSQRRVVAVGVERAAGGKERHTVVQDEARIKTQRAGTNDYQGNTTISGGTLAISSDANLGSATGILNVRGGGTLQFLANLTSDRNVTIGPGNAIFDTNGRDATLGGAITGGSASTEFHKIGAGTLTLGGGTTPIPGSSRLLPGR